MLIGLSGRAGAGKTTVANYLVSKGFTKDAYARTLKEAVSLVFGVPMEILTGDLDAKNQVAPYWGLTYREIMQLFGTEACRATFGDNIWEKVLWNRHTLLDYDLVLDDVRFVNEGAAILSRGGMVIEVERPGVTEGEHASEKRLPDGLISLTLWNTGSKADLYGLVDQWI